MPAPKTKAVPSSNGTTSKGKTSVASTNGTTTPVSAVDKKDTSDQLQAALGGGRPDKKVYDVEQERIKSEIDALQAQLSAVRDKISLTTKSGPGNDRRTVLRAELDIKTLQDNIQKKIKDIQTAKSKTSFKSVAEVDAHIKNLEKQIDSGNMKLADEKRALQEISNSKRSRRNVESLQADQELIEADRQAVEELRKQLDDPESKAVSERYDAIKAELDEIKKESDEAYAGRNKLFEERDSIQNRLNALYDEKRETAQKFRDANDRYWTKVNEDRARRAERARSQRAAEEAQKKQEIAERLREEAEAPAFQPYIEDCQTLIDYFSGKSGDNVTFKTTPLSAKTEVAGIPKLEIRQVEAAPEGLVARKKKGEDEETYFVGKGKGKGKKGSPKGNGQADGSSTAPLNVPLATLSALLALSIPPPVSSVDVPRVVEDLKTKKAWFEANQARVTAENVAKAEAEIQRLTNAAKDAKTDAIPVGGSENPAEPVPTPIDAESLSSAVPSGEVVDKLEVVQEGVSVDES
ncbi:hypothetical protein BD779DRAFT_1667503 [Infundibulicybe gibba]|nr:hypothetical protein BD779DRAFT_1667503 [Infundibulicybe gibba]